MKWNMYFTRIEPAGAGGATGASLQLRRHQLGRGGRWRRSRHLRRVQRPRQAGCGTKMSEFDGATVARTRFSSALFMKLQLNSCSNWSKKRPEKGANTQTNTQTDRLRPIRSSSGVVFWTAKSQIPVADASKTCPQNDL